MACPLLLCAFFLSACDSLPFVGDTPTPELEWSVSYTGAAGGRDWAEVTAGEGEIVVEGQVWASPGLDVALRLEAGRSRVILWVDVCERGEYVIPLALASYDFHASITRLQRRTYELTVLRVRQCGDRDPGVVLEDEVSVQ